MIASLVSRTLLILRRWIGAERRRRLSEGGYAAIMVAIVVPTIGIGCAAVAVDTGVWYVEQQMAQKAADAAALAGVPYLPQNFDGAEDRALEVAARNGYNNDRTTNFVDVSLGEKATQLKVTVREIVKNTFGAAIGVPTTTISKSGTADYQGPAPMGSPCNTFGNEPNSGGGTSTTNAPTGTAQASPAFANCLRNPQLWGTIQGPAVDKQWGDRYQSLTCTGTTGSFTSTFGCANNKNTEYSPDGYFFVVKVGAGAIKREIKLQLFDPGYVESGTDCETLKPSSNFTANMNPYIGGDAPTRYSPASNNLPAGGAPTCTGDHVSGSGSPPTTPVVTSYALRDQTDTQNPLKAAIIPGCVKQFAGVRTVPTGDDLKATSTIYDEQLAQTFHNWYTLCAFTPQREGDYYLQVQSGVRVGGTAVSNTKGNSPIIYTNNPKVGSGVTDETSGTGDNSFSIRAVTQPGLQNLVSVSGYNHMPIYAHGDSNSAVFNLIRVLPGAAGQFVSFSFFDVADAAGTTGGTVTVTPPLDATWPGDLDGPFPGGCKSQGGYSGPTQITLSGCSTKVTKAKNDGQVQTINIPIPPHYTCKFNTLEGCWYKVRVDFPAGSDVSDITTWDATVVGDPVRLIE